MTTDEAISMRKIQAILVRHYVDSTKLDIDVHQNSVDITGELRLGDTDRKSRDPTEVMTAVRRTCLLIEQEIRRIGGIHNIYWRLRNWDRVGTRWIPKKT